MRIMKVFFFSFFVLPGWEMADALKTKILISKCKRFSVRKLQAVVSLFSRCARQKSINLQMNSAVICTPKMFSRNKGSL